MKISLPLFVWQRRKTKPDKKIYLNKNVERNMHHAVYNKIKQEYKDIVRLAIVEAGYDLDRPLLVPLRLSYTLYPATKRKVDISNPLSIVDKFAADALVSLGLIEDDNYQFIPEVRYLWGGVDKANPRCEVKITAMENNND